MDIGIISRRYARALLDFACERANETTVYQQIGVLLEHYAQIKDIRRAVENPVVDKEEKIKLLQNATAGKDTSPELTRFFGLLLEHSGLLLLKLGYLDGNRVLLGGYLFLLTLKSVDIRLIDGGGADAAYRAHDEREQQEYRQENTYA